MIEIDDYDKIDKMLSVNMSKIGPIISIIYSR